jgi:hypothetical protein
MVALQVITAMPQYSNKSIEELRFEDYAKGNKGNNNNNNPSLSSMGSTMSTSTNPLGSLSANTFTLSGPSVGGQTNNPLFPSFGTTGTNPAPSSVPTLSLGNPTTTAPSFGTGFNVTPSLTAPSLAGPLGSTLTAPLGNSSFVFGKPATTTQSAFPSLTAPSATTGLSFNTNPSQLSFNFPTSTTQTTATTAPLGFGVGLGMFNKPPDQQQQQQQLPSFQLGNTSSFLNTGFNTQQQQQPQMNLMNLNMNMMPQNMAPLLPPPPPQPIYSTDFVRQKIDFLVKRRVEMVNDSEAKPIPQQSAEVFPAKSSLSSFSREGGRAVTTRRIVPRGMRTRLLETNFSTNGDFAHVGSNTNPAADRLALITFPQDTKKFKITAFPDQILEMSGPILTSETPERSHPFHKHLSVDSDEDPLLSNLQNASDSPYSKMPFGDDEEEETKAHFGGKHEMQDENSVFEELLALESKGYTVSPDVKNLTDSQLEKIENFTVMKPNVGKIYWPGITNLKGLDLSKIINIKPKEVFVYEDVPAPPVGFELNKTAIVTLYNIYPKDNSEESIKLLVNRLNMFCVKNESEFISYEKKGGEWSFQVAHFSRYGFDDDDEDEQQAVLPNHENKMDVENTVPLSNQQFSSPTSEGGKAFLSPSSHTENIEKLKMILTTRKSSPMKTAEPEKPKIPMIQSLPDINEILLPTSTAFIAENVKSFMASDKSLLASNRLYSRMTRSFRVGWSCDGKVATVSGFTIEIRSPMDNKQDDKNFGLLNSFLEFFVKLKSQPNMNEKELFASSITFLLDYIQSSVQQKANHKWLYLCLSLLNAIYGQPRNQSINNPVPVLSSLLNDNHDCPPESLQRRYKVFSDWFKEACKTLNNDSNFSLNRLENSPFNTFDLISVCSGFQSSGAFRSALLASQTGRDNFHQLLNQQQLHSWDSMTSNFSEMTPLRQQSHSSIQLPGIWFETSFLGNLQNYHWMEILSSIYWYYFNHSGLLTDSLSYFQQLLAENPGNILNNPRNNGLEKNSLYNLLLYNFHSSSRNSDAESLVSHYQYGMNMLKPENFENPSLDVIDSFLTVLLLELLNIIPKNSFPSLLLRQQLLFQLLSLSAASQEKSDVWKTILYVILSFDNKYSTTLPTTPMNIVSSSTAEKGGALNLSVFEVQKFLFKDLIIYCPFDTVFVLIQHSFFTQQQQTLLSAGYNFHLSELLFYCGFLVNSNNFVDNVDLLKNFQLVVPIHSLHWSSFQEVFIEKFIISLLNYFYFYESAGMNHGIRNDNSGVLFYNYADLHQIMKTFSPFIEHSSVSSTFQNYWIFLFHVIFNYLEIQLQSKQLSSFSSSATNEEIEAFKSKCVKLENIISQFYVKKSAIAGSRWEGFEEKKFFFLLQNIQSCLFQILMTLEEYSSSSFQLSSLMTPTSAIHLPESLVVQSLDYAFIQCIYNADRL